MRSAGVRCALLLSCLLVAGCVDDPVRPCDLWTASAVVSGRVTDASGAAVAFASIEIQVASAAPCEGAGDWGHTKQATTGADGDYSAEVALGNSRGLRCVRVTEVGSGASAQGEVEFVGGCDETRPPGQLDLDLVTR